MAQGGGVVSIHQSTGAGAGSTREWRWGLQKEERGGGGGLRDWDARDEKLENITAHRIALKSGSGSRSPEYVESGDSSSASENISDDEDDNVAAKNRTSNNAQAKNSKAVHPARRSNRRLKNINTLIDNDKVLDCRWTVYEFLDFIVCSRILYELASVFKDIV
uniref:Uncharacterized protein n=1 Tax=Oryza glumipatula TaxID=40148 RepID=A0A0E0AAC8_9ORYZ